MPKNLREKIMEKSDKIPGGMSVLINKQRRDDPRMYISTGMYSFDKIVGRPGLLMGHYYTIYGSSQSFKSYISGEIISSCIGYNKEKFDDPGLHFLKDSEHSYSPDFFDRRGITSEDIITLNGDTIYDLDVSLTILLKEYENELKHKKFNIDGVEKRFIELTDEERFINTPVNTIVIDTLSQVPTEMDQENKKMIKASIDVSTLLRNHQNKIYRLNFIVLLMFQEKSEIKTNPYQIKNYDNLARGIKPARYSSEVVFNMTKWKEADDSVLIKINTLSKNRLNEFTPVKESVIEYVHNKGLSDTISIIDSALEMGLTRKSGGKYVVNDKAYPAHKAAEMLKEEVFKLEFQNIGFTEYDPYRYKKSCILEGESSKEIPNYQEIEVAD